MEKFFEYKVGCPDKCNYPCDHQQYDSCVAYTYPANDCFGIKDNDEQNLGEVVYKVAGGTCEFIKRNVNDLGLLPGYGGIVPTYEAVNSLIEYASNLNSDNIQCRAPLYCLGSNLSPSGYILQNRGMQWGMQPSGDLGNFYYDLSPVLQDLPGDVQFIGADIKVIGRSTGTVQTQHAQSTSLSGAMQLTAAMMPGHAEFKLNFNTPTGQIILENTVALGGLGQIGPFNSTLQVKDYGTYQNKGGLTETQVNELQNLKLCSLETYVKNLQYINISSCEGIEYPDKNIPTVVGVQAGWLCSHERRLNNIGAEKITGHYCDQDCDKLTYITTLQEWIAKKDEEICAIQKVNDEQNVRISELEAKVEKILKMIG